MVLYLDWLYGNAGTQEDIDSLHQQVDSIVRELAEQIKGGMGVLAVETRCQRNRYPNIIFRISLVG